jgi:hypothetical protein
MNHWLAVLIEGRWFYACRNPQKGTFPVGYCAGWHYDQWIEEASTILPPDVDDHAHAKLIGLAQELLPFKAKFHDDGHATEQEANECYRQFQLDTGLAFSRPVSGELHACEVRGCQNCTTNSASLHDAICTTWYLCDDHLNRETVEKLYNMTESWSYHGS